MVVCFNDVLSAATTELVYVIALVVDHDARFVIATSGHRFFHCVIRAKFLATRSVVHLEEVIVFWKKNVQTHFSAFINPLYLRTFSSK